MQKIKTQIETERYQVGTVGVDSGTMMMCDPCYAFSKRENNEGKLIGNDIKTYDEILDDYKEGGFIFGKELGMPIKINSDNFADGVVFSTGFGDGVYPVTIDVVDCGEYGTRVKSATITFIQDDEVSEKINEMDLLMKKTREES